MSQTLPVFARGLASGNYIIIEMGGGLERECYLKEDWVKNRVRVVSNRMERQRSYFRILSEHVVSGTKPTSIFGSAC